MGVYNIYFAVEGTCILKKIYTKYLKKKSVIILNLHNLLEAMIIIIEDLFPYLDFNA